MASALGFNKLYHYIHGRPEPRVVLGGSATPYLTLQEIISLSSDAKTTRAAFQFDNMPLALGTAEGGAKLRQVIADIYGTSHITADDIVVANGTTGCNHIVHESLLKPGDHVICSYPIYPPCIEEPMHIGCTISYLRLDPHNGWAVDVAQLKRLVQPGKTKLIVLNSPGNPYGMSISGTTQREIIALAKEHNITIHVDETFRFLFYGDQADFPPSFLHHVDLGDAQVVVTSGLSKPYGLSGVRIGWIGCRNRKLRAAMISYRGMSCISVSAIDEAIATEVLKSRCRKGILNKHLELAKTNISLIQDFINAHPKQCEWVRPNSGAITFILFKDAYTGRPVDDLDFCQRLYDTKGLLLSPANAFEFDDPQRSLKGWCRLHFTVPTPNLTAGLKLLSEVLDSEKGEISNGHA